MDRCSFRSTRLLRMAPCISGMCGSSSR
jgi:hypothetical protein